MLKKVVGNCDILYFIFFGNAITKKHIIELSAKSIRLPAL